MAGYSTRYEGNFDFVTIRGAGHMVPTYKPNATYLLIESFLKNESLPVYVAPSEKYRLKFKNDKKQ